MGFFPFDIFFLFFFLTFLFQGGVRRKWGGVEGEFLICYLFSFCEESSGLFGVFFFLFFSVLHQTASQWLSPVSLCI
jgi:hypothetical protein